MLIEMQHALIELSRAKKRTQHKINDYRFLKTRAVNTLLASAKPPLDWNQIVKSLNLLPHSLAKHSSRSLPSEELKQFISEHLIDEFVAITSLLRRNSPDIVDLFTTNLDFAKEVFESHCLGWFDCCDNCGEAIHLKFDPTTSTIKMASKHLMQVNQLGCNHSEFSTLSFELHAPSRKLVISDNLNDFALKQSQQLSEKYQNFAKTRLSSISSTSKRGAARINAFYEKHNIGCIHVGKGDVSLEVYNGITLIKRPHDLPLDTHSANLTQNIAKRSFDYTVKSLYLSMMDFAEFSGLCHQQGLELHKSLKELNATILDVPSNWVIVNQESLTSNHENTLLITIKESKKSVQYQEDHHPLRVIRPNR